MTKDRKAMEMKYAVVYSGDIAPLYRIPVVIRHRIPLDIDDYYYLKENGKLPVAVWDFDSEHEAEAFVEEHYYGWRYARDWRF